MWWGLRHGDNLAMQRGIWDRMPRKVLRPYIGLFAIAACWISIVVAPRWVTLTFLGIVVVCALDAEWCRWVRKDKG